MSSDGKFSGAKFDISSSSEETSTKAKDFLVALILKSKKKGRLKKLQGQERDQGIRRTQNLQQEERDD